MTKLPRATLVHTVIRFECEEAAAPLCRDVREAQEIHPHGDRIIETLLREARIAALNDR